MDRAPRRPCPSMGDQVGPRRQLPLGSDGDDGREVRPREPATLPSWPRPKYRAVAAEDVPEGSFRDRRGVAKRDKPTGAHGLIRTAVGTVGLSTSGEPCP